MIRRLAILLLIGLVAAGCSDSGPDDGQAVLVVDGSASVTRADGAVEIVTGRTTLERGDGATVDTGTAVVSLFDGTKAELRAAGPSDAASEVLLDDRLELVGGGMLVVDGTPAVIRSGSVSVTIDGNARLDVDDDVIAVYVGRATVRGRGPDLAVPALRQAAILGAGGAVPLDYDGGDEWDRRFLAEAIAFGERLEALARGYTADLRPGTQPTAEFYESVLPALDDEREFTADLLRPGRAVGETLVGGAVAVQGRRGDFRTRWNAVFDFRDAGAAWGLVALDQGVNSAPLLDTIEVALGASPLSNDPRPTTTAPPTTTTTTTPSPTTAPPTTEAPGPDPEPGPEPEPEPDPLLGPIDEVLDDVLGALGLDPEEGPLSGGGLLGGDDGGLLGGDDGGLLGGG